MASSSAKSTLSAVLALLLSCASGQANRCASDGSAPQLRFVARLSVSGCSLLVHDTGASDGPHLAVEPVMCVTESLRSILPRYDPLIQQAYVSVPVMLRDDTMLAGVRHQLRHLSPKSVKFATVSDISISTDSKALTRALGFDWSPEYSTGVLRLGCRNESRGDFSINLASALRAAKFDAFDTVQFSASIATLEGKAAVRTYQQLTVQNRSTFDASMNKQVNLPSCRQLRFIRSIRLINCTARVHRQVDMKGHYLIEPLLCHNITNMSHEAIVFDYSRDMHYLKLDVLLQDDATLDAVRAQLADLSPRSVAFMRLWRAQSIVASALSRRFVIGSLMVSADWKSAQLRVYCKSEDLCNSLRYSVIAYPFGFWRNIKWTVTSVLDGRTACAQTVSKLTLIVPALREVDENVATTAVACEKYESKGSEMRLTCPEGKVIHILHGFYGRISEDHCRRKAMWSFNCSSSTAHSEISARCNYKRSCSVNSTNSVFGDPCPYTYKYAMASYSCVASAIVNIIG